MSAIDKSMLREKIGQAQALLKELDLDLWLTFVRESALLPDPALEMVVGTHVTWQSAFLVPAEGPTRALVGSLDRANMVDQSVFDSVDGYLEGLGEPLRAALTELAPRSIAINYSTDSEIADGLTHGMYLRLLELLDATPWVERLCSSEAIIGGLRGRKTPSEIERMRRAVDVTLEILGDARSVIRPGRTEQEVAGWILEQVRARGLDLAWDPAHCPAVFSGPDTAGAHAMPTERVVQPGHVVNIDFGVKVDGYCSDLQRTYYVPRPGESAPPEPVLRGFATIVGSISAAAAALKPGVNGEAVDTVARQHIVDAGYGEYPHALGHQIGRQAHDGAGLLAPAWERYGRRPFLPVEEGQVYTIEPRLTIDGYGIATVEEMVQVGVGGCTWLGPRQTEIWLAG